MQFEILIAETESFYDQYKVLGRKLMSDSDYSGFNTLSNLVNYVVYDGKRLIAWAGLSEKEIYLKDGVHLYGLFVDPEYQRNGLGKSLVMRRIQDYPDKHISVSIRPGKITERIVEDLGFQKHGFITPWMNWIYMRNGQTPICVVEHLLEK